ncbi:MAG: hypothetical protein P4L84_10025 [Isosphaeraceae bacterium]|nr:hypothetical protein [Isosphaeraceae bacterium]
MRNSYVADVGDFGKYGLLRALNQLGPQYRLGVLWYLTNQKETNNDGRHDSYLRYSGKKRALFRDCDPTLYDHLAIIRSQPQLDVQQIELRGILPKDTIFFRCAVPTARRDGAILAGHSTREEWAVKAQAELTKADCVFVDPDNGVSFEALPPGHRRFSHKHAYWAELQRFLLAGKSIVAYHHLGRQRGGHVRLIGTYLDLICGFGYPASAIHYRRGSARAFFLVPASVEHRTWLSNACSHFTSVWSAHCTKIGKRLT